MCAARSLGGWVKFTSHAPLEGLLDKTQALLLEACNAPMKPKPFAQRSYFA